MLRSIVTLLSCALFAATASPTAAFAEDSAGSPASSGRGSGPEEVPDNAELARRLDILAREVDDMKLGEVAGGPDSRYGFGPAASKVYSVGRGVSIGGYGEMLYEDFATENESGDPVSSRDLRGHLPLAVQPRHRPPPPSSPPGNKPVAFLVYASEPTRCLTTFESSARLPPRSNSLLRPSKARRSATGHAPA
jgi:hypothetical protein